MTSLQGVLFDVDGTLVDSNDAHALAWERAFGQNGFEITFQKIRPHIGKGGDKLMPEVSGISENSYLGKSISADRQTIFLREFLPQLRPFPRVKELLARIYACGYHLGVASSAKEEELEGLVRVAGAEEFLKVKTSSEDADRSKPDPDIVKGALAKLKLPAENVVLLGDTPYDIEAAHRAGVDVIAVRCGGWSDRDLRGALAIYDDPADLLAHYERSPFAAAGWAAASKGR